MAIVNDNSAQAFRELDERMDAFLDVLGNEGRDLISEETPVRTGNLQSHNEWEMLGNGEGRWHNDVEYAVPVEFGHPTSTGGHVPANAFMQRGLDRLTQRADQLAHEVFNA